MFTFLFSLFSTTFLNFCCLVNAVPVQSTELLAFRPTITYPTTGVVWLVGSQQNVSWLTDNIPYEIRNSTILVYLGYLEDNSENLDVDHPLATNVPIMQGSANVTVPSNATLRTDHIVVVMGDSGDRSGLFTITS